MIDHLVVASPDPARTIAELDAQGLAVVAGGRHDGMGTRNWLAGLGRGAYLEVIGPDPDQPQPDRPRPFGIDRLDRAALVAWAVRVTDLDRAQHDATAAGWETGPVQAMTRIRPDGVRLSWRLTFPTPDGPDDPLAVRPFLIDWGTSEHPAAALEAGAELATLTVSGPPGLAAHLATVTSDRRVSVRLADRPALTARLTLPGGGFCDLGA